MKKKLKTLASITLAIAASLTLSLMGTVSADAKSKLNTSTRPASQLRCTSELFLPSALCGKTYYILAAGNVLYSITLGDPDDGFRNNFIRIGTITNVQGSVLGMDFRPADGKLYALANEGASLYTINTSNASATLVSNLSPAIGSGGFNQVVFDFNPVVDAIRIISPNGQNFAVVKNAAGVFNTVVAQTPVFFSSPFDIWFNTPPRLYTGAYTNNLNGATNTLFYGFEGNGGFYVTIADQTANGSSNTGGGRLRTIGIATANAGQYLGFNSLKGIDIVTDPQTGANFLFGMPNFSFFIYLNPNQINLQTLPLDQVRYLNATGFRTLTNGLPPIVDLAIAP